MCLKTATALVGQADADAGILHGAGNADAAGIGVIGGLDGQQALLERRGDVRYLPVGQYLARLDGVAVADLPGGDADLLGQEVYYALKRKFALRNAEAAESARGRVVGVVAVTTNVGVLVAVGADGVGAGALQNGAGKRGISAGIEVYLTVEAGEDAILVAAESEGGLHVVALRVEVDGLLPGEAELDGPSHLQRAEHGHVLGRHVLLAAETAADVFVLDHDAALFPAEHDCNLLAGVVNALVGGVDLDAVLVREGDGALGLQEGMLGEGGDEALRHGVLGLRQRLLGVAAYDVALLAEVAVGVQLRRARGLGLLDVAHGLKDLIIHLHELAGLVNYLLRLADDEADGVAHHAGYIALGYHDVPVLLNVSDLVVRHVLRRQDGEDAGERLGLGGVYVQYAGPGVLGAHRAAVDHALHLDVVAVLAVAEDLRAHVGAESTLTDAELVALFKLGVNFSVAAQDGGREGDALDYLLVAGAAADVAAQGDLYLVLAGVRHLVYERLAGHDHARYAEAALDRAHLAEGIDKGLLLVVGQALDGDYAAAHGLLGREDAGLDGTAVHNDSAGAAGALAAAVLDGLEVQIVAEIAQEGLVLCGAAGNAVYFEYVLSHCVHLRLLKAAARECRKRPL